MLAECDRLYVLDFLYFFFLVVLASKVRMGTIACRKSPFFIFLPPFFLGLGLLIVLTNDFWKDKSLLLWPDEFY